MSWADNHYCICDECAHGNCVVKPLYIANGATSEKACKRYERKRESNWSKLFGTPERAARTLAKLMGKCKGMQHHCADCEFTDCCIQYVGPNSKLLEWLGGEAIA